MTFTVDAGGLGGKVIGPLFAGIQVRNLDRWCCWRSLRRGWCPTRCPGAAAGASPGGLEQLDHVAGGVLQQNLRATRSGDDVVAEPAAGGAEPVDLAGQVGDL
jgi:hypothetical protein